MVLKLNFSIFKNTSTLSLGICFHKIVEIIFLFCKILIYLYVDFWSECDMFLFVRVKIWLFYSLCLRGSSIYDLKYYEFVYILLLIVVCYELFLSLFSIIVFCDKPPLSSREIWDDTQYTWFMV